MAFAVNEDGTFQVPADPGTGFAADCGCCGDALTCACKLPDTITVGVSLSDACGFTGNPDILGRFFHIVRARLSEITGATLTRGENSCGFSGAVDPYHLDYYTLSHFYTDPVLACAEAGTLDRRELVTDGLGVTVSISTLFDAANGPVVVTVGGPGFSGTLLDVCCRSSYSVPNDSAPGTTIGVTGFDGDATCECDGCCREMQLVVADVTATPPYQRLTMTQGRHCHWFGQRFVTAEGSPTEDWHYTVSKNADGTWRLTIRITVEGATVSVCHIDSSDSPACPEDATWVNDLSCVSVLCFFCGAADDPLPDGCLTTCTTCPTDCTACPSTILVSIAGAQNASYTASRVTEPNGCRWEYNVGDVAISVTCLVSEGEPPVTRNVWQVDWADGDGFATARKSASGDCCPGGSYPDVVTNGFGGSIDITVS